jgi:hypothetical protein
VDGAKAIIDISAAAMKRRRPKGPLKKVDFIVVKSESCGLFAGDR